jgi:hypothetical protein
MAQYAGKIYLIPKQGSANPGGKWDPAGGYTAVSAIPQGAACRVYKERLFITPGQDASTNDSRLKYSNASNFDTWTASDFVDIRPGDGTKLIDLTVFQDNIILFKEDSSFVYAYDTKPADAVVRDISQIIGATRRNCVVDYEDAIFVLHRGKVYELVNLNYNRLNTKVPFTYDPTQPSGGTGWAEATFITRFGDRLIVRYYNRISASQTLHYFGPMVGIPSNVSTSANDLYYAGSAIQNKLGTVVMADGFDSTINEKDPTNTDIVTKIVTKNFDLAIPHQFKRLYYWAVDVLTNRSVTGLVTPVVVTFQTTWNDLSTKTWNSLTTWGQPLTSPATTTVVASTGTGVKRRIIKLGKGMRYRQISFEVDGVCNGTTGDGPFRIFTIMAITDSREVVTKQVS